MKVYIRYELEHRKYSSDCVVGVFLTENPDTKKMEEKKDKLLAPFLPKKEGGDELAIIICDHLNSQIIVIN